MECIVRKLQIKSLGGLVKEGGILKNTLVLEIVLTGWRATMEFWISINIRKQGKSLAMLQWFEPLL